MKAEKPLTVYVVINKLKVSAFFTSQAETTQGSGKMMMDGDNGKVCLLRRRDTTKLKEIS